MITLSLNISVKTSEIKMTGEVRHARVKCYISQLSSNKYNMGKAWNNKYREKTRNRQPNKPLTALTGKVNKCYHSLRLK